MLENFAYDGKNRLPLPKNYPQPSVKLLKFSWPLFSWWKFYMKKWITVVIVDILFLIYFTWFVHNFINHKYNVLLKRNDVCLIPLNTFVCVCVFHVHVTVKTSSVWNSWNVREQVNDVVLKTFLSSAKSFHRYFSTEPNHFILLTH